MIRKKIANLDKITRMVRDFIYGHLDKRNKPSLVKLERKNIGQNASQIYCLMKYLPFIFWEFKDQLSQEWKTMECLLQIMQILYSTVITEKHVLRLEKLIQDHLNDIVIVYALRLIFKHHMLVHYPNFIRTNGPAKHGWMMRYEAKHKTFTNHAHRLNNFKNIAKSLADRHQQLICKKISFEPKIVPSKTARCFSACENSQKFIHHFLNRDIKTVSELDFLHFNSVEYRKGLMLIYDGNVYEISSVIMDVNDDYSLLCESYEMITFDVSRNSIQIEKNPNAISTLFNVRSLKSHLSYDKIYSNGKYYILAETLDFFDLF